MKEIISKELLSLVLGREVTAISEDIDNGADFEVYFKAIRYVCLPDEMLYSLNLDTLGRLCKEWCRDSDFYLDSFLSQLSGVCVIWTEYNEKVFDSSKLDCKTELEAIIKATEWVAKEKGLQ